MDGLLFYILLLVAYIAYKLKFLFFPAINKWAGHPAKRLKGKFIQTDFLILPSDFEASSHLSYEVTQRGMATKMELACLAHFDSLHDKNEFLQANLKLFKREFFQNQNFGPYGVVAIKDKQENFYVNINLECSPESFTLIMNQLKEKQTVLIRVFAFEVKNKKEFLADHFSILTNESIFGAKDFAERYLKHVLKEGGLDQENFTALKEKFEPALKSNSNNYRQN
jgi:hypothetical protein